jgi:hypothetical protein
MKLVLDRPLHALGATSVPYGQIVPKPAGFAASQPADVRLERVST